LSCILISVNIASILIFFCCFLFFNTFLWQFLVVAADVELLNFVVFNILFSHLTRKNVANHVGQQPTNIPASEAYLPAFYAPSTVNSGLPAMPFPYMSTGIADTWSTNSASLVPNTNGACSAMAELLL
jgi:hypothetical protein